jgi:MATE family multidrug resistance protein
VLRLGLPSGLHMLAEVGAFALVSVMTGRLGTDTVAANQIALGLESFTFMGALGVSGATSVRVGHSIGAGESPRRAGLLGIGLGAAVMMMGSVVFAIVPRPLIALFTNDPAIVDIGASLLRVAAIFQLFDGVQAVGAGALRGAGDVRYVLYAGIGAYWVVGVPSALFFGFTLHGGAVGMWWGLSASLMTAATAFLVRFLILSRRTILRV